MLSRHVEFVHTNYTQTLNSNFVKHRRQKLPDESCRSCGGALINCTLCAECREVISMICVLCGSRTLEKFHGYCMYQVENVQTSSELSIKIPT